jgi:tetratricopeptide (TPR) repeat protein
MWAKIKKRFLNVHENDTAARYTFLYEQLEEVRIRQSSKSPKDALEDIDEYIEIARQAYQEFPEDGFFKSALYSKLASRCSYIIGSSTLSKHLRPSGQLLNNTQREQIYTDTSEIIEHCLKETEKSSNNSYSCATQAYLWRATCYNDAGMIDKAIDELTRAIQYLNKLDSFGRYEFYFFRSQLYLQRGDYSEALVDVDRAVSLGENLNDYDIRQAHDLKIRVDAAMKKRPNRNN